MPGQVRGHVVDRWGEWGSDQVGRKVVAEWAGQAVWLCEDAEGVFIKKKPSEWPCRVRVARNQEVSVCGQ